MSHANRFSLQFFQSQIAIYQTAFSILAGEVDIGADGQQIRIKMVPDAEVSNLSFNPQVTMSLDSEPTDLESAITQQLSGLAASLLMQNHAEGYGTMMLSQAHTLAERLADMMVPDWRTSQSQLVHDIKKRCYERAADLCAAHKERIAKVEALLIRQDSLSAADLKAV